MPFYYNIGCSLYFLECALHIVSSRVSPPPLPPKKKKRKKNWTHLVLASSPPPPSPPPLKKTLNLSGPSLYEKKLSKFWRTWFPPSRTHDRYPRPKKRRLIFWRNKRFYFQQWNYNTFESLNMNIQLQNLKIKEKLRFF